MKQKAVSEAVTHEDDYFHKLLELMDTLRGPNGCPWDQEQTRETLKPLLVEEAYEVLVGVRQCQRMLKQWERGSRFSMRKEKRRIKG